MRIQSFFFLSPSRRQSSQTCHSTEEIKTHTFPVLPMRSTKQRHTLVHCSTWSMCAAFCFSVDSVSHHCIIVDCCGYAQKEIKGGCSWNCSEPKKVTHMSVTEPALPCRRHRLMAWLSKLAWLGTVLKPTSSKAPAYSCLWTGFVTNFQATFHVTSQADSNRKEAEHYARVDLQAGF